MTTEMPQPAIDAPADDWLVYADTLQQAGDPRGELIVLHHAVEKGRPAAQRDAFITEHVESLLGQAARHIAAYRITWRWCLIEAVDITVSPANDEDAKNMVQALLAAPAAGSLQSLTLTGAVSNAEETVDLSATISAMSLDWPSSCKSLRLIDQRAARCTRLVSRDWQPEENLVSFGDLGPILALPALESLHITTADPHQLHFGLDTIQAPNLRHFTLHGLRYGEDHGDHPSNLSETLAEATWPHLESFDLRIPETWVAGYVDDSNAYHTPYGDMDMDLDYHDELDEGDNNGIDWSSELGPLLSSLKPLPLRRLALTSFDSADSLLRALVTYGLAETLEELDLSCSSLSSAEVPTMLEHSELFRALKLLDVRQTAISKSNAGRLTGLGPEVKHSTGSGARYRYIVGME